jgi:hypothetical protein
MYTKFERSLVTKVVAAVPPLYAEQRMQFATSLPTIALLSVVIVGVLGGWLSAVLFTARAIVTSPPIVVPLVFSTFFWLELLPPILWALSFFPLQNRRLVGWRLFAGGTALSLVGALLRFNLIGLLFSCAILYVTLQCYDEYELR